MSNGRKVQSHRKMGTKFTVSGEKRRNASYIQRTKSDKGVA